jgi:hypothetical protein
LGVGHPASFILRPVHSILQIFFIDDIELNLGRKDERSPILLNKGNKMHGFHKMT